MFRRILGFIGLILVILLCVYAYQRYKQAKVLDSGAIHCTGCMSPEQAARFDREDHGETADGQSEHKSETARQSAANLDGQTTPAQPMQASSEAVTTQPVTSQPVGANQTQGTYPPSVPGGMAVAPSTMAPAGSTLSPNPPNGMAFAGKGSYQWYRQGDLTWRIDTTTGRSCIIYATMEEWRKPLVISHGCGRES